MLKIFRETSIFYLLLDNTSCSYKICTAEASTGISSSTCPPQPLLPYSLQDKKLTVQLHPRTYLLALCVLQLLSSALTQATCVAIYQQLKKIRIWKRKSKKKKCQWQFGCLLHMFDNGMGNLTLDVGINIQQMSERRNKYEHKRVSYFEFDSRLKSELFLYR